MNFKERVFAVLRHEEPDQVPFSHYCTPTEPPPGGEFERELRNKGMGYKAWSYTVSSVMPNVTTETHVQGNILTTTYHTPVGDVTTKIRTDQKRTHRHAALNLEWMIKDVADYDPVIYMIEDAVYSMNETLFYQTERDLGGDGVVNDSISCSPYEMSWSYFGQQKWFSEQLRHPHEFEKLLKALEKRVDKTMSLIMNSPAEIVNLGSINGFYGPRQFEKYDLPFYKKYTDLLHARGKLCMVHAHSINLRFLKDLIPKTGLDVIESFTLPPIGNLSVEEARRAWGDRIVIWAGFPDPVLYWEVEEIRKYTESILKSEWASYGFLMGMQEQGLNGIIDDRSEFYVKRGLRTVMDIINKHSRHKCK